MKKIIFAAALIVLTIAIGIAADLTGVYRGTIMFRDNSLELTYRLKAEGEKLTGTITTEYGELPLLEGKVSGNDFSYQLDIGNGPFESKGKFMGDSIVVTTSVEGRDMVNTFKRVTE